RSSRSAASGRSTSTRRGPSSCSRGPTGTAPPASSSRACAMLEAMWNDWMRGAEVEPSLYGADFSRLGEQIETLLAAGCRIFHFEAVDDVPGTVAAAREHG